MTAADGAFNGFFGHFHRAWVRRCVSALLSRRRLPAFMLVAMRVTSSGASVFGVVLTISISTFLLGYCSSSRRPSGCAPLPRQGAPSADARLRTRSSPSSGGWPSPRCCWARGSQSSRAPSGGSSARLPVRVLGRQPGDVQVFTLGTLAFLLAYAAVGFALLGAPRPRRRHHPSTTPPRRRPDERAAVAAPYDVLFEPVRIGPFDEGTAYRVPCCNGMGYRDPSAQAAMRKIKAEGGWSVVCTEQVEIRATSDIAPFIRLPRIWDDQDLPALKRIARRDPRGGGLAGIELAHNSMNAPSQLSR